MTSSLSGSVFAGKSSLGLGDFWDDVSDWWDNKLPGQTSNPNTVGANTSNFTSVGANTSNFTSCPAGATYQYNPSTNTGSCVPDAGTTVNVGGKQVVPQVQPDGCITGFQYVKRADGTGSCVAQANVTTTSSTWGTQSYTAGGDSYNPAGSTVCPKNFVWDPKSGKCIGQGDPAKACPAGTVLDKINNTCDKVKTSGGGGGGGSNVSPVPPGPGPVPPDGGGMMAGINPLNVAAVVLGLAAVGAVVWKVKKKRDAEYSPNWDDYESNCGHDW